MTEPKKREWIRKGTWSAYRLPVSYQVEERLEANRPQHQRLKEVRLE
jgi:hypothetical protein